MGVGEGEENGSSIEFILGIFPPVKEYQKEKKNGHYKVFKNQQINHPSFSPRPPAIILLPSGWTSSQREGGGRVNSEGGSTVRELFFQNAEKKQRTVVLLPLLSWSPSSPFAFCAIGIFPKVTEFASPSGGAAQGEEGESPVFLQLVIKDAGEECPRGGGGHPERDLLGVVKGLHEFFVFICFPSVIYGTLLAAPQKTTTKAAMEKETVP